MSEPTGPLAAAPSSPSGPSPAQEPDFEVFVERRSHGLLRRLLTTYRHFLGLLFGGLSAWLRSRPKRKRRRLSYVLLWILGLFTRPLVGRRLRRQPFPVQLRKRLEALGPTYIKLGQILSLREDILPRSITQELERLQDRLPAVPFSRYMELLEEELGRPPDELFAWVAPKPLGSASIGQTHRATTLDGDLVILKIVKPGIREILRRDVILLKVLGTMLQLFLSRFQPRRMIDEFCHYTLLEADLRREAENAETFAANFADLPDVVFPRIYPQFTTESLLVMEYLSGSKPGDPAVRGLAPEDRARVIDLGAAAIIRMLYRDGFFHADLHPGNLIVLPGPKAGFIDLGMVGRFDEELRRALLYYYYCLVMGDVVNAARYLASVAEIGGRSDPKGFRREVEEIIRRWQRSRGFAEFSIARLIMESVSKAASFRMYFPVEMVLMVKAIVTFEAVGQQLEPDFDVAGVSRKHISQIFLNQFSPLRIARESLRGAPELVDALVKAPTLVTEGLRALEQATRPRPENPFTGIRGTVFAGFCVVAGAIVAASNGPWPLWATLFAAGVLLALRRR